MTEKKIAWTKIWCPFYRGVRLEEFDCSHMVSWWRGSRNETLRPNEDKTWFCCFYGSFMVDNKMLFSFQNNAVWNPLTSERRRKWQDVHEASFLLFAKCPGVGILFTTKCPTLGTHLVSIPRGFARGVLAAGISDSHIKLVARGKRNNVPSAMVQYKLYRMEWKHVFHIIGRSQR